MEISLNHSSAPATELPICPGCSARNAVMLQREQSCNPLALYLEEIGEKGEGYLCKQCALIYRFPLPVLERSKRIFSQSMMNNRHHPEMVKRGSLDYFKEDISESAEVTLARVEFGRGQYRRIERFVRRFDLPVRFGRGAKLLDVGCGRGYALAAFHEKGWAVLGIEPDPRYETFIRNLWGFPVKCGTFEEVPFLSDEQFDLIFFNQSWHFICDYPLCFTKIKSLLKPKGLIFIECHTLDRNGNKVGWKKARAALTNYHCSIVWQHNSYIKLFNKYGFDVLGIKNTGSGSCSVIAAKREDGLLETIPPFFRPRIRFDHWRIAYAKYQHFRYYHMLWRGISSAGKAVKQVLPI